MNTETTNFIEDAAGRVRQENIARLEEIRLVHGEAVAKATSAVADSLTLGSGVLRIARSDEMSPQAILSNMMARDLMAKLLNLSAYHVRTAYSLNDSQWEFVKTAAEEIAQHTADGAAAMGATLGAMREAQNSDVLRQ